jgi:O-antigen/teichoic acid export membrane protein
LINILRIRVHSLFNDQKFKEILHGSLYSYFAKIAATLLSIATSIIGARYYGPDMMGLVAIISSILSIASLLGMLGMGTSMLKYIPEYIGKYSINAGVALYKRFIFLTFIFSSLVGIALYFLSTIIADTIFHKPNLAFFISLAAGMVVFSSLNGINKMMLRSVKKIKLYAMLEFLPKVISLVLLLIMTFMYYEKYNLIYIAYGTTIVMTLITSVYMIIFLMTLSKNPQSFVLPDYKNIISISFPMFLTGGVSLIIGQTEIFMIGVFRTANELGIYSVVLALATLPIFILRSINVIAAPKFSELYHAGKMDELQYVAQKSSKLAFWMALPVFLALIFFGQLILNIYGEKFLVGYIPLMFLVAGQFINSTSGSVGYFLNMTGYQKEYRNMIIGSMIINVIINYLLIPKYGIVGASIASLASMSFSNIAAIFFIKHKLNFYMFYLPYISKR